MALKTKAVQLQSTCKTLSVVEGRPSSYSLHGANTGVILHRKTVARVDSLLPSGASREPRWVFCPFFIIAFH